MNTDPPLILASQSPRRAQLLCDAGFVFEQRSPPFADPDQPPEHLNGHEAEDYASGLARQKAESLASEINGPALCLPRTRSVSLPMAISSANPSIARTPNRC